MEEFDQKRLNALQKALEREEKPERIADLYDHIGMIYFTQQFVTHATCLGELHGQRGDAAWNAFTKLVKMYPNHIEGRNYLAAIILICGTNPAEALPYLEEIENPIFQCRPEGEELIPEIGRESRIKLSEEDSKALRDLVASQMKAPFGMGYFESERLLLRGVALYLCGDTGEWRNCLENAASDPYMLQIFPGPVAKPVIDGVKNRLEPEKYQPLREVILKYHETSRRRFEQMMNIFKKYRPELGSESAD